jgi:hypothetical protein
MRNKQRIEELEIKNKEFEAREGELEKTVKNILDVVNQLVDQWIDFNRALNDFADKMDKEREEWETEQAAREVNAKTSKSGIWKRPKK